MKLKLLSMILAVLMFLGSFSIVSLIPVAADDDKDEAKELADRIAEHLTKKYVTPEAKLATMTKKLDKNGYELWVLAETGEIAFVNKASGQIIFSNPWNIGNASASTDTKAELMSQIFIHYDNNGQDAVFNSFEEAAQRGQILVKNIKNGVRVEYTIGREETRLLVPRYIRQERFEIKIAKPIFEGMIEDGIIDAEKLQYGNDYLQYVHRGKKKSDNAAFYFNKFMAIYSLKDPNTAENAELANTIIQTWPATAKIGGIFVVANDASTNELRQIEAQIKKYCPDYTYEELDKDHVECQYEGQDIAPPLFKLALEYTIDDWGLIVTLPASGIRFNESLYKLDKIEVLPFMGAGTNPNSGYTFLPDGSGTLFDFEELNTTQKVTITGQMYGSDYAYHTLTATHQEVFRYPVFGIVEDYEFSRSEIAAGGSSSGDSSSESSSGTASTTTAATTTAAPETTTAPSGSTNPGDGTTDAPEEELSDKFIQSGGFVAIIEEGDSLASLTTFHGGATSPYNTVKMSFIPRPSDKYDLSGSLSVGTSTNTWEVVSKRKYVGNYTIRYIMLTDQNIAKEKGLENTYEPTWLGMAKAYSDYMVSKGVLTKLTDKDVKEDIPLYVETFGTFETLEKILSVPVNVMTPLSTFEDVKTMYNDISASGVANINFKLTGFANGGLYASVPSKLDWEKAVGGDEGFTDLVNYAAQKDFGIFPDFDFVFVNSSTNTMFDSLNLKKHAVMTIDNRYTSKRDYSATYQSYISYYELAISPAYFMHFYTEFTENYKKFTTAGISVSTLGQYLNSDFDEDEPYNRADAQEYTEKLFAQIESEYSKVMTDAGNAYSWKYVDYIINVPVTSSRYNKSSNAVPFMGVVLHGFVEFAGTPTNMEGNISYAFLKAIENGAGLYFKLVYQNAEKLKEDTKLSQNYSVRYEIWKDELIAMYLQLNGLLKDVQTSQIVGHEFLTGARVPDADESEADRIAKEEALEALKKAEEFEKQRQLIANRLKGKSESKEMIAATLNSLLGDKKSLNEALINSINNELAVVDTLLANIAKAQILYGIAPNKGTLAAAQAKYDAAMAEVYASQKTVDKAQEAYDKTMKSYNDAIAALETAQETYNKIPVNAAKLALDAAQAEYDKLVADKAEQTLIDAAKKTLDDAKAAYDKALADIDAEKAAYEAAKAEYDALKAKVDAAKKEMSDAKLAMNKATLDASKTDAEKEALKKEYEDKKAAYDKLAEEEAPAKAKFDEAQAKYDSVVKPIEDAEAALKTAKETYDKVVVPVDRVLAEIEKDYYKLGLAVDEAKAALTAAQTAYDKLVADKAEQTKIDEAKKALDAAQAEHDKLVSEDKAFVDAYNQYKTVLADYNKYLKTIKTAEAALEAAKAAHDALVANNPKQAEIDAAKAELDPLLEEDKAYGGSVAAAESKYKDSISRMNSAVSRMCNTYVGIFKHGATGTTHFTNATLAKDYYTKANGFKDSLVSEIEATYASVKETYDQIMKEIDNCFYGERPADDKDEKKAYGVKEALEKASAYIYTAETPEEEKKTVVSYKEYLEQLEKAEADKKEEVEEETIPDRYVEDSGNIILLTFENGKTFILNYNTFDVVVTVNGTEYKVDKCGSYKVEVKDENGNLVKDEDGNIKKKTVYTGYLVINEGGAN